MFDQNFGISKVIPRLKNIEVEKLTTLIMEYGVDDAEDLALLTESDLLQSGFLKKVEARKLIKKWKKG